MAKRVAVLASGGGSNLQAIIDYFASAAVDERPQVALVASDRAGAGALGRAAAHDIAGVALDREARGAGMLELLETHQVDLVVLAGYLRFVPNAVTTAYHGRIVNIHPALLPAFGGAGMYGLKVHEAVLASGARVTGATVHFVSDEYDRGAIIAQWPVPVHDGDTPAQLAQRVIHVEHVLYPRVVRALAEGRVQLGDDGRSLGWNQRGDVVHYSASQSDDLLEESIDRCLAPSAPSR